MNNIFILKISPRFNIYLCNINLTRCLTFQSKMMSSQAQTQCGYSSYGNYLYGAFLSILTFVIGAIMLFYVVS